MGNSLLIEYDMDEDARFCGVTLLRQGLPKLFKLSWSSIAEASRVTLNNRDPHLSYFQYETLAQVAKSFVSGNTIELRSSVKTNGDNAQISWSPEAQAWVIASQNVTMLARNEKDVL